MKKLDFFDIFTSIKDEAGVSLFEVQVLAKGSISGQTGVGEHPEDTLMADFSTIATGVPFTFVNAMAIDFAAAFSGTFDDGLALIDTGLLPEDIKLQYRVTTATGVGRWNTIHFYALCSPGEATITVDPPTGLLEDQANFTWYWGFQAQRANGDPLGVGDQLLIEILREDLSVLAFTYLNVGDDPLDSADTTSSVGWTSLGPRDGNVATYLTTTVGFSGANLLAGNTAMKFNKKLFAVDNGIAGIDQGENMTVRLTCITVDCQQEPESSTGIMAPLIFVELLCPFMGKQGASPYPEYRYPVPGDGTSYDLIPGKDTCVSIDWYGVSIRNGSLTAAIKSIDIDLFKNLTSDGFYDATTAGVHFPLNPMLYADSQPSCAAGGSTSTPLLGFDFSEWFVDPAEGWNNGEGPVGTYTADGRVGCNVTTIFSLPYYGDVLCLQDWQMELSASNTDSLNSWPLESWIFDNTSTAILMARADAEVYGQYTTNVGLIASLAFNVNTTRLTSFSGTSGWAFNNGLTVYDDPLGGGGSSTFYNVVNPTGPEVTGGLADPPTGGASANGITINHEFPSEGIFQIFFRLTLNGSGVSTRIESFVIVASA